MNRSPVVRAARDADAHGLIGLMAGCYAEYPGCVLDVDGEAPYLRGVASSYAAWRGRCWVAELDGEVVGSVAALPAAAGGGMELRLLYVASGQRRRGLGALLVGLVEAEASRRGAGFVELWTDTRFTDAHRLYERHGYRRGRTRELHDRSRSVEYHYRKDLPAV